MIDLFAKYAPMLALALAVVVFFAYYITRKSNWIISRPLVIDGDTIYTNGKKIRVHGIDAPESGQTGGEAATTWLKEIVSKGPITVEQTDTDKYGRVVARLFNGGGDIGQKMVLDGYALASFHPDYKEDQKRAEKFRRGLWNAPGGIHDPQKFRREKQRSAS